MALQAFSDDELVAFFNEFYTANGKRPTYDDMIRAGLKAGTYRFNRLRSCWARAGNVSMSEIQAPVVYQPSDLQRECEASKSLSRMPKPETERYQGRPIDPPKLSVTEEAAKHYRKAWKGIKGEAGA